MRGSVASISLRLFFRTLLGVACLGALQACGGEEASPEASGDGTAPSATVSGGASGMGGVGGALAPDSTAMAGQMNGGSISAGGEMNAGGSANSGGDGGSAGGSVGSGGAPGSLLEVACDPEASGKPELRAALSLTADPGAGAADYLDTCGFCHGSDGKGLVTGDFTSPSLHSLAWTCEQVEILMNGKPETAMLGFLDDRGAQWVADKIAHSQATFTEPASVE